MQSRRGHTTRRMRSRGLLLRVLAAATMLALGAVPLGHPVSAQADEAIAVVGPLPYPGVDFVGATPSLLGVRPDGTSIYTVVTIPNPPEGDPAGRYLFEHRIDADRIGPPRRAEDPFPMNGNYSPLQVSFDPENPRTFVLGTDQITSNKSIGELDLETLEVVRQVDIGTILPGFAGLGLTFSPSDNRLYLVGEFAVNSYGITFSKLYGRPVGPGPAMVAVDADTLSVAWVHPLPGCTNVLESASAGALIARSPLRPVLYTVCVGGSLNGVASTSQVAGASLARVHFSPEAAMGDESSFRDEYFPVAGLYRGGTANTTGIAGFDARTERVFLQSLSARTPGAWVFDGRQGAWVGFVAAPDDNDRFLGVNPTNGRYYLGGSHTAPAGESAIGYINVTDGRATPISQGQLVRGVYPQGFIVADPTSNRLFVAAWTDPDENYFTRPMVLADNTSSIVPLEPVDYDALTQDLPDDRSRINFSASTGGFGTRYEIVGGYEGFTSGAPQETQAVVAAPGLAFGDRGATFSSVPSVDLRPGGAAATAAIAQADEATSADTTDADNDTGGSGVARFPYGVQSCLDGDGTKVESSQDPDDGSGHASVICDLANQQTIATANYDGSSSADGMTVNTSSFDTRTYRDPDGGAVTEVTAVAEGINVGLYSIDRVTATVTTRANGRPGTTGVVYERRIEGADPGDGSGPKNCVMRYETGKEPQRSADCDDLEGPFEGAVETRMELRFPEPELTATPQGAFASLQETKADYLNGLTLNNDEARYLPAMEVTVYHDSTEKSRTVVHLAAVRANSILTRSPSGTVEPEPGPTSTPTETATVGPEQPGDPGGPEAGGPIDVQPVEPGPTTAPTTAPTEPVAAAPPPTAGPTAAGWTPTVRSPSEAALVGALLALFGWPIADLVRRRRLLEVLR